MTRFLTALAALLAFSIPSIMPSVVTAQAQGGSQMRDVIIEEDTDYYGFDIKTQRRVSFDQCQQACLHLNECRAFTYNVRARFCFLKSDFKTATPFVGAISGRIVSQSAEPDLGAAPRLSYLSASWYRSAEQLKQTITKMQGNDTGFEEMLARGRDEMGFDNVAGAVGWFQSAIATRPDSSDAWLALADASARLALTVQNRSEARRARNDAVSAAVNAYGTSRTRSDRAASLSRLAHSLEAANWYRESINSFKLALDLKENPADRDDYMRLLKAHGFRMLTHSLDADLKVPRICLQFSEDLKKGFSDFASYVRVDQQPPQSIDVSTRQICVEGLAHGKSYQIDLREGLPAENGERLLSNIQLDLYVRDRAPSMRFTGNNYVLPASNRRGIPLVSVNSDEAKLALYRVSDRSLAQLMRGSNFLKQLSDWELSSLVYNLGAPVWKGAIDIRPKKNQDVVTSIPIDEALPERQPGVYLMTASTKTKNLRDYEALASQWFVISDIGLTTFMSSNRAASGEDATMGGLQVFVRSLASAEPLAGVEVELIARNNDVLGRGTSDAKGLVSFDAGLVRGKEGLAPAVVTAAKDDTDFVFLDMTRAGFDLSDRGVTGRASPQGVDVYAWTERGVYRPGEQVHVSALARDASARAVDDLPLTFAFYRPDGVELQRLVGDGRALGGYAVSLPLTSNAPRGTWQVQVLADPDEPALAEMRFLVEDFIPDRTDMALKPESDMITPGSVATGSIEGRYLYGAPAAGLDVEGEVLVRESRSRKGFDGYVFGLAEEDKAGTERIPLDILPPLDAQGHGRYEVALDTLKASTRPKVADLVMRMREGSGRAIERRVRYQVRPDTVMVGIKPLFEDERVSENSEAGFQLLAIDPDGAQVARTGLDWALIKLERHYQWYRDNGRWRFESVDLERKVADGSIDLSADNDPAALSLPVEWGRYRLAVGDTTSIEFTAGWSSGGSLDSPDGLQLALDKASYKAGETAKLQVSPRFAGRLLIAIGTDSIRDTLSVDIPEEGATIDIPVDKDWGAGAYLLATLYRPADKEASRNPARAIGVQWLEIDPEDRALQVEFKLDEGLRPNEQMIIPVTVKGVKAGEEAYIQVALVDEGILKLTNHPSPDPKGRYFGQRQLGVAIRDLYGRLIDGSQGATGALRTGGDSLGPRMQSAGDKPTQELVAFVSGIVRLDDQGEAEVAFDIPQFNGSARLMATAWTKQAVGGSDKDALIRDPIIVHASLPKVLAPGDDSRALIELTNLEADEGDYVISVKTNKALKPDLTQIPQVVRLNRDERVSLSLPIVAMAEGRGDVTITLSQVTEETDGLADIIHEASLPIRSGILPVTQVMSLPLAKGDSFTVDQSLLAGLQVDGAQLTVAVNEPGGYDIASLLLQLDRYPYGCAEQITSRALPLLYARDIALTLPEHLAGLSGKEMDKRLQQAVDKLLSYQSNVGGFSLWGGNAPDDAWLSAYVVDFLTRAKERGLDVAAEPMKRALTSLQNRLAYQSDLGRDSASVAYGLYALARNRAVSAGDLRYYVETKLTEFKTPLARAQLGAALALYGDRNRADRAFNSALSLANTLAAKQTMPEEQVYAFASLQRDVAAMQALAGELSPAPDALSGIKALAAELYDPSRRLSTQEQAWMVMAARSSLANPQDLGIAVNGAPLKGSLSQTLSGSSLANAPLVIDNDGTKALQVNVTTIGTPTEPLPASENGLVIARSYHKLDGSPTSMAEIRQNERFVVVLSVNQLDDLPSRIMISDLLPAGLEIENPHLLKNSDLKDFSWLPKTNVAHLEFRDDRLLAAINHDRGATRTYTLAYQVRAVTPGSYMHPAAVVEDMYRPDRSARTASGFMRVVR
ncbi:alpha-2-macroglobulin family protein [Cohaesibacter sp. CAU 1516]|uniref:alpha-2-macroglobulin family protein n=1 Tax=Cohaesibacter sp. CAU 1516 TaxID=2576038 RepID=UPI001484D356|nr:alpha-2-macroglobulin family protein [Cohaesibacter sp. CAU 1516]